MIVEPAEESGGARIVANLAVEAGGFVPGGEHLHDHCSEHFEGKSGQITFLLDGGERTLRAGEEVTVTPGTWHRWWNTGAGEVQIRVRIALRFEDAILVFSGLCADGHTNAERRPSPLLGALIASRYRQEHRYRQPRDAVQRLLFPALAALARRRGLQSTIDRYLDLEMHPSSEPGLGGLPQHVMRRVARRD